MNQNVEFNFRDDAKTNHLTQKLNDRINLFIAPATLTLMYLSWQHIFFVVKKALKTILIDKFFLTALKHLIFNNKTIDDSAFYTMFINEQYHIS